MQSMLLIGALAYAAMVGDERRASQTDEGHRLHRASKFSICSQHKNSFKAWTSRLARELSQLRRHAIKWAGKGELPDRPGRRRQRGCDGRARQGRCGDRTAATTVTTTFSVQREINSLPIFAAKAVVVDEPQCALLPVQGAQGQGSTKELTPSKPVGATTARLRPYQGQGHADSRRPYTPLPSGEGGWIEGHGPGHQDDRPPISPTAHSSCETGEANSDTLVSTSAKYVEGRRWALDTANRGR